MPSRPASDRFSAERVLGSPIRNLVSILVFMAVVVVCAIAAYMAAGWSFSDASYMVALTVYTVGYGEVRHIDTPYLHAVTMGLMVLGCTGMILLTSALVQLFTVMQLRQLLGANRMKARIEHMADHAVVCGYGRIGVMLAKELSDAGMPLVVLERDATRLAEAEAAGHCTLAGDATDESALLAAHIERARVLATVLPDDAANVFITLSARNLNAGLEIIARGEMPSTERKLRHAGANQVVLPTHIGAERIARMILFPASKGLEDDVRLRGTMGGLETLGLGLEVVEVIDRCAARGLTVAQAERHGAGAFLIAQISHGAEGAFVRAAPDEILLPGSRLAIVARDRAAAHALFSVETRIKAGRTHF